MLVTAIMPTRGRVRSSLCEKAIFSFVRQNYKQKHLLILDDADDPSFAEPLFDIAQISYLRTDQRMNIPQKRNLMCRFAPGELICHFDSDDYSAPNRIADQVNRLQKYGRSVTGYSSMIFKDIEEDRFFIYRGTAQYALGTSLMYRRSWWKDNSFPDNKPTGEDNEFVQQAVNYRQFISVEGGELMCARLHSNNTSRRPKDVFEPIERPAFFPDV